MMPASVAVCGSCVSRDPFSSRFNPDYARWFSVTAEVFQPSLISLMSPPVEGDDIAELLHGPGTGTDGEALDYQVRISREDATRSFLADLVAAQPEYLVLDFFADIHCGALRLPDGRYLTDNRWMLHPTAFYARLKAEGGLTHLRIGRDTEEYLALWTEAADRFAAYVAEHCPATRVIVQRGLNTDEVVAADRALPGRVRDFRPKVKLNVPRANALWARLDDHVIDTHGWDSIDLRAEGYTSYATHPWKPFFVHYTNDYYHRFLAELLTRDLAGELSEDDWAQVREIAGSGHDRSVALTTAGEARRAQLAARAQELEDLGPLRAVKFALGQRIRKTRGRPAQGAPPKETR